MKLGFNLLLWTPHVTLAHEPILRALKKTGYDGVEIPMFEGDPAHYARLGELLDKIGLSRSVVSVIGPSGKNPLSPDRAHQAAAVDYAKWTIDCTAALGAGIEDTMRRDGFRATRVVERWAVAPLPPLLDDVATLPMLVWRIVASLSPAERWAWLAWIWGAAFLARRFRRSARR